MGTFEYSVSLEISDSARCCVKELIAETHIRVTSALKFCFWFSYSSTKILALRLLGLQDETLVNDRTRNASIIDPVRLSLTVMQPSCALLSSLASSKTIADLRFCQVELRHRDE
jgi:hypothetical protein